MKRSTESLPRLWKALNLLQDYVSTGFSRSHPELVLTQPQKVVTQTAEAPRAQPSRAEAPRPEAPRAEVARPQPSRTEAQPQPVQVAQTAGTPVDDSPETIAAEIAACVKCELCAGRKTTVPGEGSLRPPVMFVGEGPGEEEDRTGRPFVGAAGRYLDKWIPAIGLSREECFIANVVKCRPPRNREPHPEEITACLPYLERQIRVVKPLTLCCLGRIAAHTLLQTTASLGGLRGKVHHWQGIPLVVTYHPSAVLRDSTLRKPVWDDLKLLKTLIPAQK